MPAPSKPQLAIYAALAVAALLIGARFLRSGGGGGTPPVTLSPAASAPDGASSAPSGAPASTAAGGGLVVDVKGAVRRPGVYRLRAGARALDAVRRAGGLTGHADRVGVNLAARVVDGGEVVVPERGTTARPASTASGGAGGSDGAGGPLSIDLETATEAQLEQLDGVGPATAAKIVAYRTQHGGISSVDELDQVSGIGPAKLAAIHAQLGR
jgi:competence protein ComEA